MAKEIINSTLPPSDEVLAYPLVLKFMKVDWITCATDEVDSKRAEAFLLGAVFADLVTEDLLECYRIEDIEWSTYHCARESGVVPDEFPRPLDY